MNFDNTWYIIEHNKKHEVISHKELMQLESSSYQMIQNYRTHHEAIMEMSRLVSQGITDLNARLNNIKTH